MKIPTSFTSAISNTFYDKTVTKYATSTTTDSEGFVRKTVGNTSTFLGNVRMDNLNKLQEDYGIKQEINLAITTNADLTTNDVLSYDGIKYDVVGVFEFDSHNLILCRKWKQ